MERKWFFVERWPRNSRPIREQIEVKKVMFGDDDELLTQMKEPDYFDCPKSDGITISELGPTGKYISREDLEEKYFSK